MSHEIELKLGLPASALPALRRHPLLAFAAALVALQVAPARALLEAGCAVALASDFNPGTSPTVNFPLVLTLGVSQLRLSVAEAFVAATVNGAAAVGLAGRVGQVAVGYAADLALFDVADHREIPYWYGDHRCVATWVGGRPAHRS